MTLPHSTGRRTQAALDPVKEEAWGARPRTVSAAALLGVRLNSRRPAPTAYSDVILCVSSGWGALRPAPAGVDTRTTLSPARTHPRGITMASCANFYNMLDPCVARLLSSLAGA